MYNIKEEIESLIQTINTTFKGTRNSLSLRLNFWEVLARFNIVIRGLEKINTQLDTSLNFQVADMDFEKYREFAKFDVLRFFQTISRRNEEDDRNTDINTITNLLPIGEDEFSFTSDVLDPFKNAMHQLCDEDRIDSRKMTSALRNAYDRLRTLLDEIQDKIENAPAHLYAEFCEKIVNNNNAFRFYFGQDNSVKRYQKWIQDIGHPSFEELRAKQKQEIYELLKSGFFRFAKAPIGSEIKNRKLKISSDDLEVDCEIVDGIDVECAKFDKFTEWKEDCILVFNQERMGLYLFKNYRNFEEEDIDNLCEFDIMMELIHEEMAQLKPPLSKYLKRYQEEQDEELLNDIKKVFEPFKNYLKEELRESLIEEYLEKLLFDSELKEEAKKRLSGQSKKTYCTSIVIALSYCNIFKPQYNNSKDDLGSALNKGFEWHNKSTFVDYLKNTDYNREELNRWTSSIMDDLKEHQFSR